MKGTEGLRRNLRKARGKEAKLSFMGYTLMENRSALIDRVPAAKATDKGGDWRADVGARSASASPVDLARAGEPGAGAKQTRQSKSRPRVAGYFLAGILVDLGRSDLVHLRQRGVLCASRHFPGIAAIVSLYGLFADASTIGNTCPFFGFLPDGVLQLIADQITVISRQGNETIGAAFVVGLLIALGSANSGMAALFDALNVVYDEREKRSLVRFYATTLLFTLVGIVFVILATREWSSYR